MQAVTGRGQLLVVGLHAALGLSVLLSTTILAALHDQITAPLWGLYGTILGLAGAGSAAVAAIGTATNGRASLPQTTVDNLQDTLRATMEHLAGARAQIDQGAITGGRRATDPKPEPSPPPPTTTV